MLVTSATTIAALIITALVTPFISLQTFGIFSALLVFWDYILVMTFYPTVVCLYAKWFEYKSLFCCVNNSIFSFLLPETIKNWGKWRDKNEFTRCITCQSSDYMLIKQKQDENHDEFHQEDENKEKSERWVYLLLIQMYDVLLFRKFRRFFVLLYFVLFIAIIIVGASFTQPADEAVQFVAEGTNLHDAEEYSDEFAVKWILLYIFLHSCLFIENIIAKRKSFTSYRLLGN